MSQRYWYKAGADAHWATVGNWWSDAAHAVAAGAAPVNGDQVYVLGATAPDTGPAATLRLAGLDASGLLADLPAAVTANVVIQPGGRLVLGASAAAVARFPVSAMDVHRFALDANNANWSEVTAEDCSDLRAYQDGTEIPLWVQPGASQAGTSAVVFVRTRSATGTVRIVGGGSGAWQATTRLPAGIADALTHQVGFVCNHSAGGADNPLTSFVHPSAVKIPGGLGGHVWWCVITPWGNAAWANPDKYEDPCIFFSDNGTTWTAANVDGLGNSNIDYAYQAGVTIAHDPVLVWDPDAAKLYCYWGIASGGGHRLYRSESANGTTWSAKVQVFDFTEVGQGISPAIVRRGPGDWIMLCVDVMQATARLRVYTSADGVAWTAGAFAPTALPDGWMGLWHIDVQRDAANGCYRMLATATRRSAAGASSAGQLLSATSTDLLNWTVDPLPFYQGGGTWGSGLPYKSALFPIDNGHWGLMVCEQTADKTRWEVATASLATTWTPRSISGLLGVFIGGDDFDDDNLSTPKWVLTQGNASAAAGALTVTRTAGAAGKVLGGDVLGNAWTMIFRAKRNHAGARFAIGIGDDAFPVGMLWNWDGLGGLTLGGAAAANQALDTNYHLFQITRAGNDFTLWIDGVQKLTDTIAVSQDAPQVVIYASGADVDQGCVVDWLVYYWNGSQAPTPLLGRHEWGGLADGIGRTVATATGVYRATR